MSTDHTRLPSQRTTAASPGDEIDAANGVGSLAEWAIHLLRQAAAVQLDERSYFLEERNVWQPDSWLIQRCWSRLAGVPALGPALEVASLAQARHPTAPYQALYRAARRVDGRPDLAEAVTEQLSKMGGRLFNLPGSTVSAVQREQLLFVAASAMQVDEPGLALTCLELIDQRLKAWDQLIVHPQLRTILAETVAQIGAHPLTVALIRSSIRRFGDAGAHFVQSVAEAVGNQRSAGSSAPSAARLLGRCVETVRYASLTTLHSHRVAVAVLAQAGLADEVLSHLTTIANVQEARRASGLALRKNDQALLRQVKRPQANADVDFLVYTLQEAIRVLPLEQATREQRVGLARQLATLGVGSDGWTAAGAAATLIDLGALKYAVEVVDRISDSDPTRSEGAIALVRGLLARDEVELADRQARKALAWAKAYEGQNPERATVWGLAEVYLESGRPERALALLRARETTPAFLDRLRGLFEKRVSDDQLRDNRLRLHALLKLSQRGANDGDPAEQEIQLLLHQLRTWAPRLLEGEALQGFYVDGLMRPLLHAGRWEETRGLLPEIVAVLATGGGDKHARHVERFADLLAQVANKQPTDSQLRQAVEICIRDLWERDARRGIWQCVHSVEGSLALLLALQGPSAVVAVARAAAADGPGWTATLQRPKNGVSASER